MCGVVSECVLAKKNVCAGRGEGVSVCVMSELAGAKKKNVIFSPAPGDGPPFFPFPFFFFFSISGSRYEYLYNIWDSFEVFASKNKLPPHAHPLVSLRSAFTTSFTPRFTCLCLDAAIRDIRARGEMIEIGMSIRFV